MTQPRVQFKVIEGPHKGRHLKFKSHDTLLAGRSDFAQLKLDKDLHFSRNHFRIEVQPPSSRLIDLDSTNGTFVNGERVTDVWLKNGDLISGGRTNILVSVDSAGQESLPNLADTAVAHQQPLVGESQVGPYRIIRELGRGSMGAVYLASHPETTEQIALKVVNPRQAQTEASAATFVREASILQKLRHKRIVPCVDSGVDNGRIYIAMKYIDTIDFPALLAKRSVAQRIHGISIVLAQVLSGLHYAHKLGFVHRDIKPSNILVNRDGSKLRAHLADFGLAKNYMEAGLSQISSDHEIKGTLAFMAPEQVISCRYAQPTSDLFSSAATAYTLLSGEFIYNLNDHKTPIASILNTGPIPISKRVKGVPQGFVEILHMALAYEPAERFQSALEMRTAVLKFARGI